MAALTTSKLGDVKMSLGRWFVKAFSVTTGAAAADEWIATGFSRVEAVLGHAVQGTTDRGVNFVLNARGTGVAAETNAGDLGIEATGAVTVHVLVLGRP